MKKLNQTGFGVVEALLVIVIVALIAFVGLYVANAKQNTDVTLNTASQSAVQPARQFKFKELAVEFNLPNTLTKLSYGATESKDDTSASAAPAGSYYLYDTSMDGLVKQCSPAEANQPYYTPGFMSITKTDGTFSPPTDSEIDAGASPNLLKQFNGFYITYGVPNGSPCDGTNTAADNKFVAKVNQDQKAFKTAFKATAAAIK